jgi:hypothetical protein
MEEMRCRGAGVSVLCNGEVVHPSVSVASVIGKLGCCGASSGVRGAELTCTKLAGAGDCSSSHQHHLLVVANHTHTFSNRAPRVCEVRMSFIDLVSIKAL